MFISPAYAQGLPGGNILSDTLLIPMILVFAIMYFLIIRPQQQRLKAHREMVANVRRGDSVVTAGGLVGKVTKVIDDSEVQVEIADGVRVRVMKATLTEVRAKGEPVKDDTKKKK
jgi:preprotein translocase subunit YajC